MGLPRGAPRRIPPRACLRRVPKTLPRALTLSDTEGLLDAQEGGFTTGPGTLRALRDLVRVSEPRGSTAKMRISSAPLRVTGKGGKERIVPFGWAAADALEDYLPAPG